MTIEDIDGIKEIGKLDDNFLFFTCGNKNYRGICDKKGNILIDKLFGLIIKYDDVNYFLVRLAKDSYSIIKYDGKKISIDENRYNYFRGHDNYLIIGNDKEISNSINYTEYVSVFDKDGRELFHVYDASITYLEEDMFLIHANFRKQENDYLVSEDDFKDIYYFVVNHEGFSLPRLGEFDENNMYHGGYMLQKINGKYRYLDRSGIARFNEGDKWYSYATDFHKSMPSGKYTAIVREDKSVIIKVIDTDGKTLFSSIDDYLGYEYKNTYYDLYIRRKRGINKYGVVDLQGHEIVPCIYDEINVASNGICFCYIKNRVYYYTANGDILGISERLKYIDNQTSTEVIIVKNEKDNKYIFMNKDGEFLFNGLYDSIMDYDNPRNITKRKEISYSANNIYEYERYSVIDKERKEIIFTYPSDIKSNDRPIIKDNFIIASENNNKLIYLISLSNNSIYLLNDYLGIIDSVEVVSENNIIVTNDNKRYLCYIHRDMMCLPEKYDITYDKSIAHKIRRRILSV